MKRKEALLVVRKDSVSVDAWEGTDIDVTIRAGALTVKARALSVLVTLAQGKPVEIEMTKEDEDES